MNKITKESFIELLVLAGRRALWTFSEAALAMIAYTSSSGHVNWTAVLEVSFTAAIVSILKSIVAGMPEFSDDGDLVITNDSCVVNFGLNEDAIKSKKSIRLKVKPTSNSDNT